MPATVAPAAISKFRQLVTRPRKMSESLPENWLGEVISVIEDGKVAAIPLGLPFAGADDDGPLMGPLPLTLEAATITIFARGETGEQVLDPESAPEFIALNQPMVDENGTWKYDPPEGVVMLSGRNYLAAITCDQGEGAECRCYRFVVLKA